MSLKLSKIEKFQIYRSSGYDLAYSCFVSLLQGQAFDGQVTGDEFFECRLEMFKVIIQDYSKAFELSSFPR